MDPREAARNDILRGILVAVGIVSMEFLAAFVVTGAYLAAVILSLALIGVPIADSVRNWRAA